MRFSKRSGGVLLAALCASFWSLPAAATQSFDFTFTAPLTNGSPGHGDVASGSGTVTTKDADPNGYYRVIDASGSFVAYQGEQNARSITAATAIVGFFDPPADAFIYRDTNGHLVSDSILFFNPDTFNGIGFQRSTDGSYGGFFSEVGVENASLTFTQAAAALPEPGTWALMLLGFGMAGVVLRRRKAPVAAHA